LVGSGVFSDSGAVTEIGSLSGLPIITQITTGKFNLEPSDYQSQVMYFTPTTGVVRAYAVQPGTPPPCQVGRRCTHLQPHPDRAPHDQAFGATGRWTC